MDFTASRKEGLNVDPYPGKLTRRITFYYKKAKTVKIPYSEFIDAVKLARKN